MIFPKMTKANYFVSVMILVTAILLLAFGALESDWWLFAAGVLFGVMAVVWIYSPRFRIYSQSQAIYFPENLPFHKRFDLRDLADAYGLDQLVRDCGELVVDQMALIREVVPDESRDCFDVVADQTALFLMPVRFFMNSRAVGGNVDADSGGDSGGNIWIEGWVVAGVLEERITPAAMALVGDRNKAIEEVHVLLKRLELSHEEGVVL